MVFFANFDFAQLLLYAFWIFFALLIIWIQRENMREGYPLQSEVTGRSIDAGPFTLPSPKTFKLPHGGGEKSFPNGEVEDQRVAAVPMEKFPGSPLVPTGNPLADGVGPAAYARRSDKPDMMHHGGVKIVPMSAAPEFAVVGPRNDPRGAPVLDAKEHQVGTLAEMWVDKAEQLVRYVEIDLGAAGTRLCPMTLVRLSGGKAHIHSLIGDEQFAGVPQIKTPGQVTLLEEDMISAYYCGGKLYAEPSRQEPLL